MIRSLALFLMLSATASAQELKIVVPSNTDGYSINAKLIAPYVSKYLPEKPNVVIQEFPGAASLVAANYIYNVAPKDGNTIGTFYKNIPLMGALGGPTIKFEPSKFTWLGSTADGREDAVILWSNKPGPVDRYRTEELVVGSENVVAGDPTLLVRDLLDIKIKLVAGYASSSTARLALERKEIDAAAYSLIGIKTAKPDWLKPDSEIKPMLQFGNGTSRHKDYPDIPTLAEYTKQKELLSVYEKQYVLLRPFVAPPNIPAARAQELRVAFEKAVSDPEFLDKAKKANIDVNYIGWQESQQIVNETVNASEQTLQKIRDMK
jgi:tripartite-type tricarboxylate transporter receptor subunit TctC